MRNTRLFFFYFAQLFLEWEIFHTNAVEKIESQILRSITFFENRAVIVALDRSQMKMWYMRIAQLNSHSANIQIAHLRL
jgi:hypothetical protein